MLKILKTILLIMLVGLLLTNCACGKSEEDDGYKSLLTGQVNVTIVKENTLFFPTISGNVVMSAIPDELEVVIQGLKIPVDVVSQTVSANGLYVLYFRTVHALNELKANKTYDVDLRFTIAGKTFRVEKFSSFSVKENYSAVNENTMDLDSNWSPLD